MTSRLRAPSIRRALLLAFACAAPPAALRHACHAFSSPPSRVSAAGTLGPGCAPSRALLPSPSDGCSPSRSSRGSSAGSDNQVAGRGKAARGRLTEDGARPDIAVLRSREDYTAFLERDERLCVIKFHANWCKSCQRFGVKFRHLAFTQGDRLDIEGSVIRAGEVRFAEAEYSASAALCKSLNIKKLPTVHMHRRGEKLVDMVCKPSLFHLVVDEVHLLLEGAKLPSLVTLERELGFTAGGNENITDTSFDDLADEIMTSLRKDAEEAAAEKEKSTWFPFTF